MSEQGGTKHNVGLTHRQVEGWVRGAKPDTELRADRGLYLRKTKSGSHWVLRYRSPVTGKQTRLDLWAEDPAGIVSFPKAPLDQARIRAAALRSKIADGVDPLIAAEEARKARATAAEAARLALEAEKRQREEELAAAARRVTVRKLFEQWQRAELTPHALADGSRIGRKDGGEWVRQSFERRVFPVMGEVAAEDITTAELLGILDETKADGRRRTANVLLADLRQMFRFAAERSIVRINPLQSIKRKTVGGNDVERERVLSESEVQDLARALPLANMAPRSVCAVWLILSTAARVGEAMGARWEDVNLEARTWYLPTTKNQRDHTIHLSDFALAQMKALAGLRETCPDESPSPWVFPASDPAKPVCTKSFGKQLSDRQREPERRMSNRTKATDALALTGGRWTAHDLRRTAASIMARLGSGGDTIDECLNHKISSKARRIYIRDRRPADQARAFDALGAELQRLMNGQTQDGNVVPLMSRTAHAA